MEGEVEQEERKALVKKARWEIGSEVVAGLYRSREEMEVAQGNLNRSGQVVPQWVPVSLSRIQR